MLKRQEVKAKLTTKANTSKEVGIMLMLMKVTDLVQILTLTKISIMKIITGINNNITGKEECRKMLNSKLKSIMKFKKKY